MNKTIQWGIMGLGNIAHKFVQDLKHVEGCQLYAVGSRNLEKTQTFSKQYGAPRCYDSYEALVADPKVDIIYVATPQTLHFENTLMALRAGKHVLCEKPLAVNTQQVKTMIQEAKARNLFFMEALWTRFIPGTQELLRLLREGEIGEVNYINANFGIVIPKNPESRLFKKSLGGGSLLDIGIYTVYLSLLIMGVPSEIQATGRMTDTQVDAFCGMLFSYPNGKKAVLESSIENCTPVEARIYGSKGSITMHENFHRTEKLSVVKNSKISMSDKYAGLQVIEKKHVGNGYTHEIEEVVSCLQRGETESSQMSHQNSIDLIETLDRIREKIGLRYKADEETA